MKSAKVYVDVPAAFDQEGRLRPLAFVRENGRKYKIERVLDVKPFSAMCASGRSDRYTIRGNGRERYLYFERSAEMSGDLLGKWFGERKAG